MNVMLGPDVYVNASVALGSPPEQVVQRVLAKHKGQTKTTPWILDRVAAMLSQIPEFKPDAVTNQIAVIKQYVNLIDGKADEFPPDQWTQALVAGAKQAGVTRVVTDHPDLADKDEVDGVEFLSSEAWLIEQTTPPPPPAG